MHPSLFKLSGVFILFLLSSCVTNQQLQEENKRIMDSWLGSHKSDLIRSWGPPGRYESDGKGGEILIWETRQTHGVVLTGTYYERTSYPYRMFYADQNGKLYYWRTGTR
jgi:hypothetical protein